MFVFIGAGKTTLVSLLTKAKLNSVEAFENSGMFSIVDENCLISGISTTTSQTTIPNLMVHEKSGTMYYDCHGFNDTRGVPHDISVSYLTRKLIEKTTAIKLILVVSHTSVQNYTGDRHGFKNLAKNAITFIRNVEKYKNAIGLIVTKVENRETTINGRKQLVADETIILSIKIFLEQLKEDLKYQNDEIECAEKREENNKIIKFIEILLPKHNGQCERIGILRLADQKGPVANMKILQKERKHIKGLIHNNLHYVPKEDADFGYTVSDESKNEIHKIIEEMQSVLVDDVARFGREIKKFYEEQEKSIIDLKKLADMMCGAHTEISKQNYDQLNLFLAFLLNVAQHLNICISTECKSKFSSDIKLTQFLLFVSNVSLSNSFHIYDGLMDIKNYLNDSYKWYNFLMIFHDALCAYEVQNNLKYYEANKNKVIAKCTIPMYLHRNIKDTGLELLAESIGCQSCYYTVANIQLNYSKAKMLTMILQQTLDESINSFEISRTEQKLVVKGYNVKIKDIDYRSEKFMEVFALNNLYIDGDIDKTGQSAQITFIAPKWHIIGDRQIILNGENGKPHTEMQGGGKNGLPGNPGNYKC